MVQRRRGRDRKGGDSQHVVVGIFVKNIIVEERKG